MNAIGFKTSLPIGERDSFIQFVTDKPTVQEYDLLVKILAVSVNPVDFKIRQNAAKGIILDTPKIIGWDAVGVVEEIGDKVSLFKVGDQVYYAGDLNRPGCNAQYHVVDERIVGNKPNNLTLAQSAAIPLTGLTAWELLFDRMRLSVEKDRGKSILIIGGAGGVGSILIQIAKHVLGLKVFATASRSETIQWCKNYGADYVVDHKNLTASIHSLGFREIDFIVDLADINTYFDSIVELIKPQGHVVSITGSNIPLYLNKLKNKSVSFSWEFMYTRSMFKTEDMVEQHNILNKISDLLDRGVLKTTLNKIINGFKVESFKEAHSIIESGKSIGKIVIQF